jgi:HEAT repeat protein
MPKVAVRIIALLLIAGSFGATPATAPAGPDLAAMIADLKSNDADREMKAANALAAMGSRGEPAIPQLMKLLDGRCITTGWYNEARPGPNPQSCAANALVKIGPAAADELTRSMKDGTPAFRVNAVFTLAAFGTDEHIDTITASASDPSPEVRSMVIWVLARSANPKALDARLAALKDSDAGIRVQATETFSNFNPGLNVKWTSPTFQSVHTIAMAIVLLLHDSTDGVRLSAARVLANLRDPGAVDPLLNSLSTGTDSERVEIATQLARFHDRKATRAMLDVLAQVKPTGTVGYDLFVRSFGEVKDPLATTALLSILQDPNSLVRNEAASSLGEIGDRSAVPALLASLNTPRQSPATQSASREEKMHAAEAVFAADRLIKCSATALGRIGDARAVDPLLRLLPLEVARITANPDRFVHWGGRDIAEYDWSSVFAIATALGELRDPRAIHPLVDLLFDPRFVQDKWFSHALINFHDPRVMLELGDRVAKGEGRSQNTEDVINAYTDQHFLYGSDPLADFPKWWTENRWHYAAVATQPAAH